MLYKELLGVIKSRRNMMFIVLIIIIPLIDLVQGVFSRSIGDYICNPSAYSTRPTGSMLAHPAFASYLSGTTHGHLWQMIVIWLIPLFVLNMISDGYILEKNRNYTNIVYVRCNKKKYIISKYIASFIVPTITMFASLILNFAIALLVFNGGTNFYGLEIFKQENGYLGFVFNNPNKAYVLYIFMASIVTGMCGVFCQSMALMFKEYKKTYAVSFFVWIILVICPYSITYLYQPFIEYGAKYIMAAITIFFVIVAASIIVAFVKEKKDEI